MCTAPQTIFVPRDGIDTDEGHKTVEELGQGIARSLDKLLGDPDRALAILGAVQSPATLERVKEAMGKGRVIRPSSPVEGAGETRTATPAVIEVEAGSDTWREECFGPVGFIVPVKDAHAAIGAAANLVAEKGAITALLHATDDMLIDEAEEAFARVGAPLSVNFTGPVIVNQSAAFSDFHVSGLNPAGTATLTDQSFVTNRFSVATVRRPAAA
jgi:acyl-CoA reductase-like NAD-dependent aldehyde dehydrogenase